MDYQMAACVAHVADHMANDPRECMNDLHCKTKGVYQFPISVTIFLEGLCSSRREWKGGREKRGLGYEVMGGLQDAAAQAQDCEDLQSHTRQDSAYSCR